jgi:hypothetical protein
MSGVTWVVESYLNAAVDRVSAAARMQGHPVAPWDGDDDRRLPSSGARAVFLGSLQGCARFAGRWTPGVFGPTPDFAVSHWTPKIPELVLNVDWRRMPAGEVSPTCVPWPRVFVRPDGAHKAFGGRVLDRDALSPGALDHGYYFDDLALPVILAPAALVGLEWRFVMVQGRVVAQSGYLADGRTPSPSTAPAAAIEVAERAAARAQLAPVVVADVCQLGQAYKLVEFNPFSGADLYLCDASAVVRAVSAL